VNYSLEEYLQDLIALSGSQLSDVKNAPLSSDQGSPGDIPNFAQAAIILQNSSHVYSRKVEYLHGLVYKALYEFFKSTSGVSKESRGKSADSSIEEFYDFDANEDFLLLDDVIPEDFTNAKINLKEDDDDIDEPSGSVTPADQSLTRTRLSLGGLSVTRADRSSLGGIASSSQQRTLLGTLNNGSLRLVDGLCDVGDDGVLLMPGSQISTKTVFTGPTGGQLEGARSLFGEMAGTPSEFQLKADENFDDHSDGPGFAFSGDDDDHCSAPMIENDQVEIAAAHEAGKRIHKRVTFADVSIKPKRVDPWSLLDPHSNHGFKARPLRRGKTYLLPYGINLPPSECVTGASTRRVVSRTRTETKTESPRSVMMESLEAILGNRSEYPKIPVEGLVFGDEFLYLAKQHERVKATERRAERKKYLEEHTTQSQVQHACIDHDDDDDDSHDGGGFDFGGEDADDRDDYDNVGNAGMSSLDDAFQGETTGDGMFCNFSTWYFT
jgi:Condensin II complex subunit CAP-H2 or CNDH2, N-terminal/Condensin II complex subunit CAP-H2 or CNDH2, C-term